LCQQDRLPAGSRRYIFSHDRGERVREMPMTNDQ